MKDKRGSILYVGKAGNLKRRVSSYFLRSGDWKTEKLVSEIAKIDYKKTDTAIEALILEAELIKKRRPPYNVREKDDKSFLYVEITKDKFPRVLLVRGKELATSKEKRLALSRAGGPALSRVEGFGPFTSATSIRDALKIIRRIFPFSIHQPGRVGKFSKGCFEYEIKLCPGTCIGAIDRKTYLKNIRNIKLFFNGKKKQILKSLEKDMKKASKSLEFEEAVKFRGQIFALQHIQDIALITEPEIVEGPALPSTRGPRLSSVECPQAEGSRRGGLALSRRGGLALSRVEGYDISNISGNYAVGSMVVFKDGRPDKGEYRKFRIKTIIGANDVGMLKEVLRRRFHNPWPLPDVILVDGGMGQVNAAKQVLLESGLRIPTVGIAKGPDRKANRFVGSIPKGVTKKVLIRVRDEAHRFAITYHKKLRNSGFMGNT